jgi:hypothetical protein
MRMKPRVIWSFKSLTWANQRSTSTSSSLRVSVNQSVRARVAVLVHWWTDLFLYHRRANSPSLTLWLKRCPWKPRTKKTNQSKSLQVKKSNPQFKMAVLPNSLKSLRRKMKNRMRRKILSRCLVKSRSKKNKRLMNKKMSLKSIKSRSLLWTLRSLILTWKNRGPSHAKAIPWEFKCPSWT